ncbi:hypothetical protein [Halalkalicoccus subterraneus]|uniref:hypothetical protein n=1 Tax=Halalkalicoccus subterraneus TaxID=2675002 RepID=UPI000EFBFEB8|nr:hypothetical protein [Halalkalicoccus subterraneus]
MTRPVHATDPDGPPDRKSVLFCPNCDHHSPIEGDWIVRERTTSVEYRCPDCETLLTERERGYEREHERAPIARAWSAWVRAASAWLKPPKRLRA